MFTQIDDDCVQFTENEELAQVCLAADLKLRI